MAKRYEFEIKCIDTETNEVEIKTNKDNEYTGFLLIGMYDNGQLLWGEHVGAMDLANAIANSDELSEAASLARVFRGIRARKRGDAVTGVETALLNSILGGSDDGDI